VGIPQDSNGKDGNIDLILTNPPFGSDIPVTDRQILEQFDLAYTQATSTCRFY
jgi:type I restriction enzyme M protein